jgi:GlpG protein
MRMIGTLSDEAQAQRLKGYLKRRGIDVRAEGEFDAQTGHIYYQIWVEDEDKIAAAAESYARFIQDPTNAAFDTPIVEQVQEEIPDELPAAEVPKVRKKAPFTLLMLFICCCAFVLNFFEQTAQKEPGLTPLQTIFLYELPSHWSGIYDGLLGKGDLQGPLFPQIAEGEIWRLFTPIFLHGDLLHILFNMLWLWLLGRPIEHRIGVWKSLLLTAVCAAVSNTAQYLMSGPLFLGYSGVILGLAGFIWMRERVAPWEGYPIQKGTFWFLGVFVLAILGLQIGSLVVQLTVGKQFPLVIANTAHIVGALVGLVLGRFSFFAQKVPE